MSREIPNGLLTAEDILACSGHLVTIDTETNGTGIYQIYCPPADTFYIGQTLESFIKRWVRHLDYLKIGKHFNPRLQRVYNKYPYLEFSILETGEGRDFLTVREQWWMDHYRESGFSVCNMLPASGSRKGIKMSAEAVEKSRQAHLGHPVSAETRHKISEAHKRRGTMVPREGIEKSACIRKETMKGNTMALGNKMSKESKEALVSSLRGNSHAKGYQHTPEALEKIRQASLRMWAERRGNNV